MSDPLPTESAAAGPLSEAEREARIEQLLLSGLDRYFAGDYERAINIWTRVAFLERGHGRARAYIDRARGAVAERQRESDALAHAGAEAFRAGELEAARDLLTRAAAGRPASDTALVLMERLDHLDAAAEAARTLAPAPHATRVDGASVAAASSSWLKTVLVSAALAAAILAGVLRAGAWLAELPISAPVAGSTAPEDPMPVVRAADLRMARARELAGLGRSVEALRVLESIDVGDPRRTDADVLTGEIQRALLARPGAAR